MLTWLASAQPYSSHAELAKAFYTETGSTAHPDTFAKALKLAGIVRLMERFKGSFQQPKPHKSLGYSEAHRHQLPEQRYPSCLTDAEWTLVADLFEASEALASGLITPGGRCCRLAAMSCEPAAHGECCLAIFRSGTTSINLSKVERSAQIRPDIRPTSCPTARADR